MTYNSILKTGPQSISELVSAYKDKQAKQKARPHKSQAKVQANEPGLQEQSASGYTSAKKKTAMYSVRM